MVKNLSGVGGIGDNTPKAGQSKRQEPKKQNSIFEIEKKGLEEILNKPIDGSGPKFEKVNKTTINDKEKKEMQEILDKPVKSSEPKWVDA